MHFEFTQRYFRDSMRRSMAPSISYWVAAGWRYTHSITQFWFPFRLPAPVFAWYCWTWHVQRCFLSFFAPFFISHVIYASMPSKFQTPFDKESIIIYFEYPPHIWALAAIRYIPEYHVDSFWCGQSRHFRYFSTMMPLPASRMRDARTLRNFPIYTYLYSFIVKFHYVLLIIDFHIYAMLDDICSVGILDALRAESELRLSLSRFTITATQYERSTRLRISTILFLYGYYW